METVKNNNNNNKTHIAHFKHVNTAYKFLDSFKYNKISRK